MQNLSKLILLKSRSKNFTSSSGKKIYKDTTTLLDKVRHNPAAQEGKEVTEHLTKYNNILNLRS